MSSRCTLEADEPGEFYGQCTEFCGLSHANMRMRGHRPAAGPTTTRGSPNQLELADEPGGSRAAQAGETIFKSQCARCHQVNGLTDAEGKPARLAGQHPARVRRRAEPHPPHEPHHVRRRRLRPEAARAATGDLQRAVPTGTPVRVPQRGRAGEVAPQPTRRPPDVRRCRTPNGQYRGMPNLGLTEDQIDQLVAYLATLK